MDDKLLGILDNLPEKPPRSRLEPYRELIDELRRRRRTYRDIAAILAEKCHLDVSVSTIHDFVRGRSSSLPRSPRSQQPAAGSADRAVSSDTAPIETSERGRQTVHEAYQRIQALKLRIAPAKTVVEKFNFDPAEPLKLPL